MKPIQLVVATMLVMMYTMSFADAPPTPIAQINGVDVQVQPDTVLGLTIVGNSLSHMLSAHDISFILMGHEDGSAETLTVFNVEAVATICGWDSDLTDGVRVVLLGNDQTCSE